MVIKLADFEAALQKVAGVAVVQRLFGVERVPLCNDHFRIMIKNLVILKKDAFSRNNSFPV
jgi:hypothetical protein